MAHAQRLIRAALLLAALLASVSSWASFGQGSYWRASTGSVFAEVPGYYASADEACGAIGGRYGWTLVAVNYNGAIERSCLYKYMDGAVSHSTSAGVILRSGVCPVNSTSAVGGCQCNTGYNQVNTGPQAYCQLTDTGPNELPDEHRSRCAMMVALEGAAGGMLSVGNSTAYHGDVQSGTYCVPMADWGAGPSKGCMMDFVRDMVASWPDGSKSTESKWVVTANAPSTATGPNYACNVGADNKVPDKVKTSGGADCKGYVGSVNGVETCVTDKSAATGVTVDGSNGKSSTTTNNGTDTTKVDTTKTTTCSGATCTTTTTTTTTVTNNTTNSSTTNTTSSNATTSKDTCCAGEGKGSSACGGSGSGNGNGDGKSDSSFGGNCAAGFVAKSDDAVVNAMAQEQHKSNCILFETESDERRAYEAAKAKGQAGTDQTADLQGNREIAFSSADIDETDAIGGAACIGDQTIVVAGNQVTVPFSAICPYLAYLGTILTVVSYLLAARIVIRG